MRAGMAARRLEVTWHSLSAGLQVAHSTWLVDIHEFIDKNTMTGGRRSWKQCIRMRYKGRILEHGIGAEQGSSRQETRHEDIHERQVQELWGDKYLRETDGRGAIGLGRLTIWECDAMPPI